MERRDLFKNALGAIGGFFVLPKFLQAENTSKIKVENKKDNIECYMKLHKENLISTQTLLERFDIDYDKEIRLLVKQNRK